MPEYTIKREEIMIMFKGLVSSTDQGANQAADQADQDGDNSVVARILKVIQKEPTLSQKKLQILLG